MKDAHSHSRRQIGFTLIELLVVIAIIGILASLGLTAIVKGATRAKLLRARSDMVLLAASIKAYETEYGRFPVARSTEQLAADTNGDITFGPPGIGALPGSEVMIILMDLDRPPNAGHARNPHKRISTFGAMVTGTEPGVSSSDFVYRDPWGNPYVVTLDLNNDHKCHDAIYSKRSVSGPTGSVGLNALTNSKDPTGASDDFESATSFMIWSLGPDRSFDTTRADQGVNKDNILLWP
jgi:prepilin-type N-terminal cleavage/methylation domain-containing protein